MGSLFTTRFILKARLNTGDGIVILIDNLILKSTVGNYVVYSDVLDAADNVPTVMTD